MRRRAFIALASVGGALGVRPGGAQQNAAVVGYLRTRTAGSDEDLWLARVIVARLAELGFEDGRNLAFAIRSADSRSDVPVLAAELAQRRPAAVIVTDTSVVPVVRDAMPAAPIVILAGDLVAAGFAQSVARPGGLVTGVALITADLNAKRLEILAEILPRPATVLMLVDPAARVGPASVQAAAPALGLTLRMAEIGGPDDIERALGEAASGVAGIGMVNSGLFVVHRRRIIALAAAARLPTVFAWADIARDGALVAYGPSRIDVFRLLADQVARILRGERAAEIPVVQPTRIVLAVNLRVARELGVAIPPALLARADEVIE